jgi:hypothetical protein
LRQKIANHVGGRGMAMVKTTTEEVIKVGNLSALKYLFEVIGLYPPAAGSSAEGADSNDLTLALLNRLDIGKEAEAGDAKHEPATAVGSDSVE